MADRGTNFVCLDDFEQCAKSVLSKTAYDYFRTGADDELTLQDNRDAFKRYRICPRVMRDVSNLSAATTLLGHRISFPVGISPTAYQKLAHPDGEVATAKAAQDAGVAYTMSMMSTTSIEEVATEAPGSLRFFQLYVFRDRSVTLQLVRRAELAGYAAIVLTVDTQWPGKRRDDLRNGFTLPPHLKMANIAEELNMNGAALSSYVRAMFDQSVTWKDVDWLCSLTKLPVVVKGILTAEDASEAVRHGVSGIFVSNHGGRQLDTVPATIDALADVVKAVDGRCEVYVDGGVRTGNDVFKALALGAKAVFIGRPVVYGLAINGEDGVAKVLQILKEELITAMALAGCTEVESIKKCLLLRCPSIPLTLSKI